MYTYPEEQLRHITRILKNRFPKRVLSVYAFGSRIRGEYHEWSDFDVLIIVRDKTPALETEIIGIIVDEEMKMGLSFAPVIKDIEAFEMEKKHHSPFYEAIMKEGIPL